MKPATKKTLAYAMFAVVMALIYLVIGFTVDVIFRWCGDEEGISITSTMITCLVFTTAIVLAEIARNRQMGIDRSDELVRKCRKFLSATVIMFLGFMVMDMLFEHFRRKIISSALSTGFHSASPQESLTCFTKGTRRRSTRTMKTIL